jgi:hypothetical protein
LTVESREGKEKEEMNHYIDFNPYLIREQNQQTHTEVNSLRLKEQLRKKRKVRSCSRLFALVKRGRLLVGKARPQQVEERRYGHCGE